jgi:predicted Zn-dependent protease
MTDAERAALEDQIGRHLRRGEVTDAWNRLRRLVAAFPGEPLLNQRLSQLEATLDPAELGRAATGEGDPTGKNPTPMHEAESLAAAGKYAEAITIYRSLLAARPDWELVKERLAELFVLAQIAAPKRSPVKREALLQGLLDRITSRKRR